MDWLDVEVFGWLLLPRSVLTAPRQKIVVVVKLYGLHDRVFFMVDIGFTAPHFQFFTYTGSYIKYWPAKHSYIPCEAEVNLDPGDCHDLCTTVIITVPCKSLPYSGGNPPTSDLADALDLCFAFILDVFNQP
ncbi:uncharacterized protein EDB91DRAFT_81277 [Suillus paluster]|uniref:uncharacterized protein n=1 Tax=Suillus paluster TaxID=48578 RepID=UPI001B884060|nr:uncharacterized protein EDB91DRAFT_81277 [Suillus paluster]KAG1725783.1 hypothetical protein EDB91DRAFT_81277 [Suillus paluster]